MENQQLSLQSPTIILANSNGKANLCLWYKTLRSQEKVDEIMQILTCSHLDKMEEQNAT